MAETALPQATLHQLLLDALRWVDDTFERALTLRGIAGLTPTRARLLAHVGEGGTGPSELARRLGISRQAAHKHVGELVGAGLLRVETDPDNRSAQRATLTEGGAAALAAAERIHADLEAELARRLGRVRARALRATLEAPWGGAG